MWGLLMLASAVGLLVGLVVTGVSRHWLTTPIVLLLCFVPMIALGGRIWPLQALHSPAKWASAAMPSRWALRAYCSRNPTQRPRLVARPGPRRALLSGGDRTDGHPGGFDGIDAHGHRPGSRDNLHLAEPGAESINSFRCFSRFRAGVIAR